jgi:carotenoid cleavage dioxygenase
MVSSADATPPAGGAAPPVNPYLQGNYAPVNAELTVEEPLPMEGSIPDGLEGLLLRNGPNPAVVADPGEYHWFLGDGMVHAVELRGGMAVSYRNRWVRTRKLASEIGTMAPRGPSEPIDGPANTHVVFHAGRVLALVESGFPHRMTTDLRTERVEDFDGMLTSPMTAHPHRDPDSGGLAFFGYDPFGPPYLRYHELDASGLLVHSTELDIPRATMQHDFGVTASRVAFLDLPVVFDVDLATSGQSMPFTWQPDAGARVGILGRGEHGDNTTWIDIDPCYAFHVMNAFDDGDVVVLDVCRYERMFDNPPGGLLTSALPHLQRWRIDPAARRVSITDLDDRAVEFPRVDAVVAGRSYRYGYCVVASQDDTATDFIGLVRYDHQRDEAVEHRFGEGQSPGEPIFVRALDGNADDEGWVLTVVYDAARGASDVVILDASSIDGKPEAVIHLPARVPFGFHGSWVPIADYR